MRDRKKRQLADPWHGKPYYSLDAYCKNCFHHKCYKVALNAHMTCPNRDGTLGTRGCIFCSAGGSGDFAVALGASPTDRECFPDEKGLAGQLNEGLRLFHNKFVSDASGSRGEPDLIAPLWSTDKRDVLNSLHRMMREQGRMQGDRLNHLTQNSGGTAAKSNIKMPDNRI